MGEVRSLVPCY